LSSRVFKNYQINLGLPFQVKIPVAEFYAAAYPQAANAPDGESGEFASLFGGYGEYGEYGEDGTDAGGEPDGGINAVEAARREAVRREAEKILREAREEGGGIVASAKIEASRILEAAKFEADIQYNKACAQAAGEAEELRGRAQAEGRAEGKAEYDRLIAEALHMRAEAEEDYKTIMAGAEGDALDLVLGIAKKVIGGELEYNRQSLLSMIKDAFSHCTNRENVILKVSSYDYDYVNDSRDLLLSAAEGVDSLEIRRDLSLGRGACIIETAFGSVDAGAPTRLKKIEDAFYRLLSESFPEADGLIA